MVDLADSGRSRIRSYLLNHSEQQASNDHILPTCRRGLQLTQPDDHTDDPPGLTSEQTPPGTPGRKPLAPLWGFKVKTGREQLWTLKLSSVCVFTCTTYKTQKKKTSKEKLTETQETSCNSSSSSCKHLYWSVAYKKVMWKITSFAWNLKIRQKKKCVSRIIVHSDGPWTRSTVCVCMWLL